MKMRHSEGHIRRTSRLMSWASYGVILLFPLTIMVGIPRPNTGITTVFVLLPFYTWADIDADWLCDRTLRNATNTMPRMRGSFLFGDYADIPGELAADESLRFVRA